MKDIIHDFAVRITQILKDHYKYKLNSVCIYGSAVRGGLKKGSDIDFLVVLKEIKKSYSKRIKDIIPLLDAIYSTVEFIEIEKIGLSWQPSFLVLSVEEIKKHPAILIDISQEGIILEDKDDTLKDELNKVGRRLKELGSIKKVTPHGYYWLLKPGIKPGEVIKI